MYVIKNILVNSLDRINPRFSSNLRLIKIKSNSEFKSFELLSKIINNSSNVIDIGARVGFFTFAIQNILKNKKKNYHLFEPLPFNFSVLQKLFKEKPNTFIHPYGIADINGKMGLKSDNLNFFLSNNALNKTSKKTQSKINFFSFKIDTIYKLFNFQKNDFIKIDVEGFEYFVIEGAKEFTKKYSPIFFIEIELRHLSKSQIKKMIEFLYKENYISFFFNYKKNKFEETKLSIKLLENFQVNINKSNEYINNFLFLNKQKHKLEVKKIL